MVIDRILIDPIANGFTVNVVAQAEDGRWEDDTYYCKSVAQMVKLLKEAFPKTPKAE